MLHTVFYWLIAVGTITFSKENDAGTMRRWLLCACVAVAVEFIWIFKWLALCNHPLTLLIHLAPLGNAISRLKTTLCLVSHSNVCHQHLYQHIQIQTMALIRGRLL